jgi:hypothetical protein
MADDDFERLRRFLEHPGTRALMTAVTLGGFLAYAAKTFSNAEGRRTYSDQVRKAAAERRVRDAWKERQNQRHRAKTDYFNGRGGQLWAERALIVIGPEEPFPDATFEYRRGGFRETSFAIQSRSAGANLEASFDTADRTGGVRLELDDGRRWRLGIWAEQHGFRQYETSTTLPDREMARLACRLLAAPGCPFTTITLTRPESAEIRAQIWRDHVAEHPELADEPRPFR